MLLPTTAKEQPRQQGDGRQPVAPAPPKAPLVRSHLPARKEHVKVSRDDPFRDDFEFQDDVHGPIHVNRLERDVIHTPEFQRLFRLGQLGSITRRLLATQRQWRSPTPIILITNPLPKLYRN
jgi:hypothetical protein